MLASKLVLTLAVALTAVPAAAAVVAAPSTRPAAIAPFRNSVRLADGRALSFLHWSHPGRPKMLLLHGRSGYATSFQGLADHFGGRFDLYAIDMAGCGLSDWAKDGDYSIEATLADVDAFVAILGLGHVGIYGSSYGATVGLAWAAAHAEKVSFLILDDGGPTRLPDGRYPALNPGQSAPAGAALPKPEPLRFATWAEAEAWQARTCRSYCTPAQLESQLVRTPAGIVQRTDAIGLWASKRGAGFEDQWPAVRRLRVPTLVLRAGHGLLPDPITRAMGEINSLIRTVTIAAAAHTVGGTRPDEAYRATDAFLSSLPGER